MIRVVLADDQSLVRAGFSSILDKQPDLTVVGEAENGREAIRLVREQRPDVVLMDIRMPVCDGLVATAELMRDDDPPRVLVLTTFDADAYVYAALRAGASGFLLKDSTPEHLIRAVREVVAGDQILSAPIVRRLIETYVATPDPAGAARVLDKLSERERDVLRVMATGASNREIGRQLFLAETTVKSHVARVLAKLELRDRVQAVVLAYESGLVVPGGR